jgi:hypothetical protein
MISALLEFRRMAFSLTVVLLLLLVSTFNPFHGLFPPEGTRMEREGQTLGCYSSL